MNPFSGSKKFAEKVKPSNCSEALALERRKVAQLQDAYNKLSSELETCKYDNKELMNQIKSYVAEVHELKGTIRALQQEINVLDTPAVTCTIDRLRTENKALKKMVPRKKLIEYALEYAIDL